MKPNKTMLITGAKGFLGRHASKFFNDRGYYIIGVGNGAWTENEFQSWGVGEWHELDITYEGLVKLGIPVPDTIFHCAGGSSVAKSIENPNEESDKTLKSLKATLEFMKGYARNAKLIYPSSPAIHGLHTSEPINVNDISQPVSPYGIHKKEAEEMCHSHHQMNGLDIQIIRFFSVYGEGLQKQLLWDACRKLSKNQGRADFWGTGEEIRDWIHVEDALRLILSASQRPSGFEVVNGGTGTGHTVASVLSKIKSLLGSSTEINFTQQVKAGDPKYYTALMPVSWKPEVGLDDGLRRYVQWFQSVKND